MIKSIKIREHISKKEFVKLPLSIPPIKYLTRYYLPLSIAFSDENTNEWFYSSFMQMQRYKKRNLWLILYEKTPFAKSGKMKTIKTQKTSSDKLLKKILKFLKEEKYIIIRIDWLFLREIKTDEIFGHDIVIHGYDLNRKVFFISGYFPPKGHQISFSEITFETFLESFYRIRKSRLMVFKHKNSRRKFSIFMFKTGIKSYYNSRMSLLYLLAHGATYLPGRYDFGMKTHRYIREGIKKELENESANNISLVRLKGFEEFMSAMIMRLEFIKKSGRLTDIDGIIDIYKKLEKQYHLMIILFMKYNSTNDTKYLYQITELSLKCDEEERKALKELIDKF